MLAILQITFAFFALVLAGYIATRRGWLPLEAIGSTADQKTALAQFQDDFDHLPR